MRILTTIILLFSVISLMSQTNKVVASYQIEQSLITLNFEKFDSLTFEKLKTRRNQLKVYGQKDDGRNFILSSFKSNKAYNEGILDSYFFLSKGFYSNNNIKSKGLGFIYHGFKVGIWYYFDEDGNLRETVDHDKPFKFTLEDVFKFLEKEKIPIKKEWNNDIDGFYRTGINRTYNSEKSECFWEVDWFNYDTRKVERIRLDGVTGKEISRQLSDFHR